MCHVHVWRAVCFRRCVAFRGGSGCVSRLAIIDWGDVSYYVADEIQANNMDARQLRSERIIRSCQGFIQKEHANNPQIWWSCYQDNNLGHVSDMTAKDTSCPGCFVSCSQCVSLSFTTEISHKWAKPRDGVTIVGWAVKSGVIIAPSTVASNKKQNRIIKISEQCSTIWQ